VARHSGYYTARITELQEQIMQTIEDTFGGTWKANHEKSQLDENHRFQQATMSLSRYEHGYQLRAEGIGPDGEPCVETATIDLDACEHVVPNPPGTVVKATRPEPNVIQVDAKQEGRVVGQARYAVSSDGTSLTAETWGIDAQGRSFKTKIVFDRE
jgi:hypothetical protein